MEPKETETRKVSNIGRNDPEAIARAVDVLAETDSDDEPATVSGERRSGRAPASLAAIALAVGGTAWLALPRGNDAPPAPKPTFEELAQHSAEKPYDPATDTLVIDGITIKPNNSQKNTASEAILGDPRVKDYLADNPDESASLIPSSMAVGSTGTETFGVAERDIDGDGDTDAVAVELK